ncbi:Hypothetical predicted protein [Octopus vulgaris]|uniref:Uncharacterized protein n=1 Tax=Octopus vulgaris TaxID=6645 RepID=A0AA36AWK1_OCTVU|nr:Hypothetical predicted protein [Octopus vulgaris]
MRHTREVETSTRNPGKPPLPQQRFAASNTTMSPSVTEEEGANGTTSKPETTTSGYSIVLPSVMFVGAANILQRFI